MQALCQKLQDIVYMEIVYRHQDMGGGGEGTKQAQLASLSDGIHKLGSGMQGMKTNTLGLST